MNTLVRVGMTAFVWACVTAIMTMALVQSTLSSVDVEGLGFLLLVSTVITTGFFWNWGRLPAEARADHGIEAEKAKRDRLDSVLRELSDAQLRTLRDKLSTGELNEEHISYMLGEDGELISQKRRP